MLFLVSFHLDWLRCGPRSLLEEGLWGVVLELAVATRVAWVAAVVAEVVFLALLLFLFR